MTQTTVIATTPAQKSTCATCPKFNNYNESNGRGWCLAFDRSARKHHQLTSDCQNALESEQLQELLSTHNAFLKPTINGFPGRDVYKQLPELGYERIGYVSENLAGWFAHNQHGLAVAKELPNQNEALGALLDSFKPKKSIDYRSPFNTKSELELDFDEPEEQTPHSEFELGQTVKIIDEGEEHTKWASFVVVGKNYNRQCFRSTESYLNEPDWYYLLASVDRTQHQFWVGENEICHVEQSELIETADIFSI